MGREDENENKTQKTKIDVRKEREILTWGFQMIADVLQTLLYSVAVF